ncbi:MAG: FecR family protein [Bacteroidales bacterium]|nr:FecR family protein [Bacteroidales bacterium]
MEAKINPGIEILLTKFLEGKSTIGEKRQLYDLLVASENENSFKEVLFRNLNEHDEDQCDNKVIDFDHIYGNILQEIKHNDLLEIEKIKLHRKANVKRIVLYASSIAAVFIIAFSLGRIYSLSDKKTSSEPVIAVNYNEIKAPFGSKSEIKLPDGTQIMLNAGSTLRYRSDFNLSNRNLDLVGEAYFKVAKNINIPLYVSAGNISIKAVGTEFNVKAYDEEGVIETTLVEGKVEITQSGLNEEDNQYLDLIPNQKAIYIKESDSFTLEKIKSIDLSIVKPVKTIYNNILISPKVDVNQVVAWTHGKLIFRGENLDNLCVELQRKYDVNFIFKNEEIKKYRFSGVLLDETLEQVLNVIKLTAPIDYYLEGKTVFLSSDKEQINNYTKHLK